MASDAHHLIDCPELLSASGDARRAACLAICVVLFTPAGAAGQPAPIVNPRAIEFELPAGAHGNVIAYRVELFPSGSDTASAPAVRALDVPRARRPGRALRVDLREWLQGVPDGEYVATVRSLAGNGESPRSEPTEPFTISGLAGGSQERSPPDVFVSDPAAPDQDREPWPWTAVGIAMGAALLLLPLLFR